MEDKASKIKKQLREIVGAKANIPFKATVKSVTGDKCSIVLKSGLELTDVKLKATIGGDNYLLLLPKIGTGVVALSLSGELDNLSIIKIDEVEKIQYKQNGLELLIDSTDQKVSIKNGQVSLVTVMESLSTLLKQLKVFTPSGVSGTPIPTSMNAINQFETDFKKILK